MYLRYHSNPTWQKKNVMIAQYQSPLVHSATPSELIPMDQNAYQTVTYSKCRETWWISYWILPLLFVNEAAQSEINLVNKHGIFTQKQDHFIIALEPS